MSYPPGHPAIARADAAGTFVGWLLVAIAIATACGYAGASFASAVALARDLLELLTW